MKLLLDQNISQNIISSIADIYPDSSHINTLELTDKSDLAIWEYALKNDYILVTTDSTFFDKNVLSEKSPRIICVHGESITTTKMEWIIRVNENAISQFSETNEPSNCLMIKT